MTIRICTTNRGKIAEFERILDLSLVPTALSIDEIQTLDTSHACRAKAEAAYASLGEPVLVDDTGFELLALDGFPGALVTWAIGAGTTAILHRMLPPGAPCNARVVTAIGYASKAGVQQFVATLDGTVVAIPRGTNGFGFDDVFIPDGETRTLAEMSDAEKDAISPRGEALRALAAHLRTSPEGQ